MGIVDSLRACRIAAGLDATDLDLLEWRGDCLPASRKIPSGPLPWILTVRDPAEGGQNRLSRREREGGLLAGLPGARFVDIEIRSLAGMKSVLKEAEANRVTVIGSFHDFQKTPPPDRLREFAKRAEDAGCGIFKLAALTTTPRDIAALLDVLSTARIPAAVMGMGPLGFASRLLFASCGSVLNYGWLDRPNVPGQWGALELRQMLDR